MILPVHDRIRSHLTDVIASHFGLERADVPAIVIEMPPKRALGDLAVPVAFELARRLRKAPRAIAQDLAAALGDIDGIARVDAAPNGYLNFFIDRVAFVIDRMPGSTARAFAQPPDRASEKVIVEHTAINPNKAAHIGHLRNAALGDTLVRALRFRGWPVEVQNYIDDTGVQVADVVVGFRELEGQTLDGVKNIEASTRFDFYCWDLYARVTEWYGTDNARLKLRGETLHAVEAGGNEIAELAAFVADRIVRCHLKTMARLNIGYDLLGWEGDILRLQFWATAFEQLKQRGSVYRQTEGKLAGCWVMKIDDDEVLDAGAEAAAEAGDPSREKVIVRSDGTVTYVGKDIAYQFWKFGLLDRDFFYRVFEMRADGTPLWATSSAPPDAGTPPHPAFGKATAVYNVIDTRQAYLQKLVKQALAAMGFANEAERSTHFSYEMVALSHATARELGYDAAEGDGRPFVEVSGRKGLGVKADDLLDRLAEKAHLEVARRNEALSADDCRRTGIEIATAAVRYFMVKYSRVKVIAFDIEEALSFEGESGPYLQYAAVRAGNILQKLEERHGIAAGAIGAALPGVSSDAITTGDDADDVWDLMLQASRLDEITDSAIRSLELSTLAKFAFTLAQSFNGFYHRQQILREEREDARLWRAAGVAYARQQLTAALDLMGCSVPSRM